ncbi:MAG: HD-GYP domain-containing protein [Deltaproteobacteria bacterium]|nr:HD-GYP domain-containing protein [Deltaproteobacteria bacterium]
MNDFSPSSASNSPKHARSQPKTDLFHAHGPPDQSRKVSLKASIRKQLLVRICVAGALVSVALAAIVFFLEIRRLGLVVNNRANEMALRFNDEIRPVLDDASSTEQSALRNKLKMLLIAGKLNLGMGQVVCAGIYDLNGNEIVMEKDLDCEYIDVIDAFMKSSEYRLPKASKKVYKFRRINGIPHIQLSYPLTNSQGEEVAVIEGVFAISSKTTDEVVGRIMRTALEAIGIVVLTTLILYPIIITLIGRLSKLTDNLLEANIETLQALGSAIAKRDSDTDIHNYRVTLYSVTLAETLRLKRRLIRGLIKGAFLHDIGKIGISDQILLKPGKLTFEECEVMKGHVNHGIDIVGRSEWLKDATDVVGYHHEKFAGGGYPHGLSGEKIPLNARIFAIADVFDALTSSRPYKTSMPFEEAMEILSEGRGNHFDPSLLDTFNTIAKSVYEASANRPEQELREELESITRQYFSKEL